MEQIQDNQQLETAKNEIQNKQQLETVKKELPTDYANKLSAWWCQAQKPGKVFTIEYTDIEDLAEQIDKHTAEAEKRAARRKSRSERQQQSLSEQCESVISELADVYGVTAKEVIKQLQAKLETAREQEQQKAFDAERAAAAKIKAFRAAHPEFIAEWEQLQSEQQKQAIRCSKLSTLIARSKQKKADVKSVALF